MKTVVTLTLGIAASLAIGAAGYVAGTRSPAPAATAPSATATEIDRAAVEDIVHNYLVANPHVMLEVQQALEAQQMETQRLAQAETIERSSQAIFNAPGDGVVGNPEGAITVVEFFDYNCGYCQRALQDMEAMVEAHDDLRFVLKEFPILGPDSQRAHVVSMAFRQLMPEEYGSFHRELLSTEGRVDENVAIEVALAHGADEEELRQAMQDPAIIAAFQQTYDLADQLAISGTPSYVVGDEVIHGALGAEVLSQKIAEVRSQTDE